MKHYASDQLIEKAVDIWCKKLNDPIFDNGDTSDTGDMSFLLATINIINDKSKVDNMNERIEIFRDTLTRELKRLRDNPSEWFPTWLDVDYGPCKILSDSAKKAGIPESQFSCKSSVAFRENYVSASFGYGAPYINYYPMPSGRWLVTSLTGINSEMDKIIQSADNDNQLGFTVE